VKCKIIDIRGTWRDVADCARVTVSKEPGTGEPSSRWKRNMLLAEHSPIREITITAEWTDMPYWVAMHLVRHHEGCQPYVSTQRSDKTGVNRDNKPQDAPVTLRFTLNQQAIINISRKRLCRQAKEETRNAWEIFINQLYNADQFELINACVPECVYRGFCPEINSCGYSLTDEYEEELVMYRAGALHKHR
jgi:hypothetical protein